MNNTTAERRFLELSLIGVGGWAYCSFGHLCYCGHMAHPPFAVWDYLIDAAWMISFAGAAWLGFQVGRPGTSLILLLLTFVRLASGSGLLLILELPIAGVLFIITLWRSIRVVQKARHR